MKEQVLLVLALLLLGCVNQKPSNKRLEKLFKSFTECEFPKSGKIIERDNLTGINDGWEVGVIKVYDTIEFKELLIKITQNKIKSKKRVHKYGFGFSSKIANKKGNLIDSIYYQKEGYTLGTIKADGLIILEKEW